MTHTQSLPDDSVLIVGAGLAGLFLALNLAPRRAVVLSATPLGQGAASAWAQGGLAAALAPNDDPALHAADTIEAGAGLVEPAVARLLAEEGAARVLDLIKLGVPFDRSPDGALALSLEAAHSRARVARVKGDLAGKAIMDALLTAARTARHITIIEGVAALALLESASGIAGVLTRDRSGALTAFHARETVIATGGAGGLFRVTTNPQSALGGGMAMAWRAGALIADPEFMQFHPTAIDIGRDPAPLATEALRGDGAKLIDKTGRAFMCDYAAACEMAPRDVVARAIASEIKAGRGAFLDARAAVGADFADHFPTVFSVCMSAGIDPRTAPIPIAPAAHYHMGGIVTDLWGRSTLTGLSACGECASTGAHGANRLASNSLLEAVVYAYRIAERLRHSHSAPVTSALASDAPPELPADSLMQLRAAMSLQAGVTRDADGLSALLELIDALSVEHGEASPLSAARLIAAAALAREESRGGHYRSDFPALSDKAQRTFLYVRRDASALQSAALETTQ
ncbi:MAG: L-aspartate oxidase [Caulobacterales bacterium]